MDEPKVHGKMFCRLCLVSTNDHQPLEGVLHGMLEAILLNTCLRATENPIICNNCVEKIHKAFEFKSTCVNTEVTLTHFVTPQENSKVDLKMVYWIEKNSCQELRYDPELHYDHELKVCRICVDAIRSNHYASLLDTVEVNKLEDMFKIYIPELTLTLTEDPLICEKCIENFRTFSAFISTSLDTETKIKSFCEDEENEDGSQVDLGKVATPMKKDKQDTNTNENKKESNILKLFKNESLLLDLYGESDIELDDHWNAAEENERKIMKLVKEEDVDLFYRDRPDFDVQDIDCEESECESYQDSVIRFENPFPKLSYYWDVSTNQTLDFESPQPSSPEENSLSPEPSFKKCYDCKLNGSEKNGKCYSCEEKNSDSDDPKDDCCDCNKNMCCEKCKWKKEMAYDSSNSVCNTNSGKPASTKKVKKDGRKCRKVYGVEYKDMWCTQCRWKKACTRFVNRSISRR